MKKSKEIALTAHQRSGSHYVAALITINFLGHKNHGSIHHNHILPNRMLKKDSKFYVYVWREFDGIAKSMFTMRKTFGLNNVKNFETFLKSRYCDMWDPQKHDGVKVADLRGNSRTDDYVTQFFRNRQYTPKEWWEFYYGSWDRQAMKRKNVIKVSYNDLLNNFEKAMIELAIKLKSENRTFQNIDKKIGWNV